MLTLHLTDEEKRTLWRRIHNGVKHEQLAALVTEAVSFALSKPEFVSSLTPQEVANLRVLCEE